MKRVLVTGSTGQIGSELTPALRRRYGDDNVIAAGHTAKPGELLRSAGPYVALDIREKVSIEKVVGFYGINTIYHLAALLSARGEMQPELAWDVNINGLFNVLEVARHYGCAVFHPSSIGAFGPGTPRDNTPQETIQRPGTMYGITKVAGELLCDYYHSKYGVDSRGIRFPGIISSGILPGGGTTDYAVEIFYAALDRKKYTCFLAPGTYLDMMYMPDAIRAAILLMEADPANLRYRNAYNVTAMSLAPEELYAAIKKRLSDFAMAYEVDPMRQAIADSWPNCLDDSAARSDWGWSPEYDLESMVTDMLANLSEKRKAK
ncbi:MAG: UDP-glucose 4-epimerase [Desulfobacterales bacterium SG8_35]|nr:MAG: UDP-glucose 4-epimerase [Desulfobacterales bacterium SG8_35]